MCDTNMIRAYRLTCVQIKELMSASGVTTLMETTLETVALTELTLSPVLQGVPLKKYLSG